MMNTLSIAEVPPYLIEMVRRKVPQGCEVMAGTVPVVSFGDLRTAKVATLSINPSNAEFAVKGQFLHESKRRLATLESLGADDPSTLSDDQVVSVIDQCYRYFGPNAYRKWFNPLDSILQKGLQRSYYDGSACHLDLVQWATDPVWGDLSSQQQQRLLDDGAPHLSALLESGQINLVVVNGKAAWEQLAATKLAEVEDVGEIRFGTQQKRSILRVGTSSHVKFVGWTLYPQRGGLRSEDELELATWLRSVAGVTSPMTPSNDTMAPTTVRSKTEFAALLRAWHTQSDAETIGTIGNYGRAPLVTLRLGEYVVQLNSDTKRSAVAKYLAAVDTLGAESTWRVRLNTKGIANKVDFTASGPVTPGWYCYLTTPMPTEGSI